MVLPSPKFARQETVGNLFYALTTLTRAVAPDYRVVLAPCDVYLDDLNAVQPDVFVIAGASSKCRLGDDDAWYGPPDLVVEVISPSPAGVQRDRVTKFRLYERVGVREYWLVDPLARIVEVFALADGKYDLRGAYLPGETFVSSVLKDHAISVGALFGL
jgi:Uma2 family endonuclease